MHAWLQGAVGIGRGQLCWFISRRSGNTSCTPKNSQEQCRVGESLETGGKTLELIYSIFTKLPKGGPWQKQYQTVSLITGVEYQFRELTHWGGRSGPLFCPGCLVECFFPPVSPWSFSFGSGLGKEEMEGGGGYNRIVSCPVLSLSPPGGENVTRFIKYDSNMTSFSKGVTGSTAGSSRTRPMASWTLTQSKEIIYGISKGWEERLVSWITYVLKWDKPYNEH